jgi:hypothetical protein
MTKLSHINTRPSITPSKRVRHCCVSYDYTMEGIMAVAPLPCKRAVSHVLSEQCSSNRLVRSYNLIRWYTTDIVVLDMDLGARVRSDNTRLLFFEA